MRYAARDVGEGDSVIVMVVAVVTVNVDNVVGVSAGVSATAGGLPDGSRARAPPLAGASCATLDASSHDA